MTDHPVKRRKKMIEVAIPLEAINAASAREKSIRHGHPSTLHLWWARRPLAAARAVIFCQMVDDPSAVPEEFPTEEDQENERLRLFALVSDLVTWENTTNELVLNRAREEIKRSWRRACADNADHPEAAELFNPNKLPGFHDPFAGGGALPLEAQRLGLEACASDLNPVAVLINKAMIEIPPKFAGLPPVNPESQRKQDISSWKGAQGLAEDVRYYSQWMRDEAEKRIGQLYPKLEVTAEMAKDRPDLKPYVGKKLTVIAWLWARTVKSPNPAFAQVDVPLASTFMLSTKAGKEAYVEPVVDGAGYRFSVKIGKSGDLERAKHGTKLSRGANFACLMSGSPIESSHIYSEAQAGRMGARLMAIVAEGERGRVYLAPVSGHESIAKQAMPDWKPETPMPDNPRWFSPPLYGLKTFGDIFTSRQLVAMNEFANLVKDAALQVRTDLDSTSASDLRNRYNEHSATDLAYSQAVGVYLGLLVDKMAFLGTSCSYWEPAAQCPRGLYGRQAIAMTWDYAEPNVFSSSSGCWSGFVKSLLDGADDIFRLANPGMSGHAEQQNASEQTLSINKVVSTDPPYYDNIGYADLSDFFYAWLRRSQRGTFPEMFATLATPKESELVATPYRHGGKQGAEDFFLRGMTNAIRLVASQSSNAFPVTIYYAFKQSEKKADSGVASTGWETFLAAVIDAGFTIVGTWPMRTEMVAALKDVTNSLASSVILVCTKHAETRSVLARSEFRRLIRVEMPAAIKALEVSNIAPVDVAQSAIGPGMAIYSSAKAVLNPDDSPMSVREALIEINTSLDEYLSQDEGDLDPDSRFALTFFESYGYEERSYGDAEGLAIARNLSVDGVAEAGILSSVAGKVRLYQRAQLPEDWDPTTDRRLCVWEATQHLIKRLEASGEGAAAELLRQLKNLSGHGDLAANCRALAYRLYNHCEKKKQAEEARAYNGLVIAWPELERLASASSTSSSAPRQTTLI